MNDKGKFRSQPQFPALKILSECFWRLYSFLTRRRNRKLRLIIVVIAISIFLLWEYWRYITGFSSWYLGL